MYEKLNYEIVKEPWEAGKWYSMRKDELIEKIKEDSEWLKQVVKEIRECRDPAKLCAVEDVMNAACIAGKWEEWLKL